MAGGNSSSISNDNNKNHFRTYSINSSSSSNSTGNSNNHHYSNDNDIRKEETAALLEAEPDIVSIAINHSDDSDEFSKSCRICGEGEEEEDDGDEENQLVGNYYHNDQQQEQQRYPNHPTMSSTTQQQQQQKTAKQKTTKRNTDNPLIRPCKCKGSMMYIHVDCLNRWRELSPRQESHVACDLCGYRYNIYRPKFAAIVSHPYFLRSITVLLILLFTIGMAYVCKVVHIYLLGGSGVDGDHGDPDDWHGPTILWLDRVYLLAGLVSVSMLGIIYLVYCCATASSPMTGGDPSTSPAAWLCCCCGDGPWYGCYVADFKTCSGDAALGGIVVFVAFVILVTIVFGILGAFSGIYALMETAVQNVAGRVKERILDVVAQEST
ncbi:hypothetical protein BDB00DRAFT_809819 [Zychaea mexicana]|uniref:uncharacterized protein n=1 Tax=Zychaea mexicana TaxID=64656 RepID=UPI0022FE4F1C|nr:uncharacterized protein BDB00DRAFT_809819 [Zychaea mexicana]KAI9496290.1 hypothetical protein BDB00DRAFT_809819 [Zychaea mexicana]